MLTTIPNLFDKGASGIIFLNIVKEAGLDMVQLHGDEDLTYCEKVKEHVSVVKVFRVGALVPMMDGFDQVADYFLFDTDSALYGGTGQHFNWEIIKNQTMAKPYFLSGGIGPNDIKGLDRYHHLKKKDLMVF